MKRLLVACVLLLVPLSVPAQKNRPCSRGLVTAKIRGFILGMPKTEIEKSFSDIKWNVKDNGSETAVVNTFADKVRFGDVEKIEFGVYKNKLYSVDIDYSAKILPSVGTLTEDIRKAWGASEKWEGNGSASVIECRERIAILLGHPLFWLTLADNTVSKQLERIEKSRRPAFKP